MLAHAQVADSLRPGYGIYGDFDLNFHSAEFSKLPGIPNCCPRFESGDGTGFSLGVLYQLPLAAQWALDIRAGYYGYGATLTSREPIVLSVDNLPYNGAFEHEVVASLGSIGIEPLVDYRIWKGLSLMAGPRLGIVITKSYEQQERIVDPVDRGVFTDTRTRTRNVTSGDIPEASSLHAALLVGASYTLPLNREGTLTAAPEVLFSLGLTPVISGYTWNTHSLRLGVAIVYSPLPAVPPPPPPPAPLPPPPPPPPPPPALAVDVTAVGLGQDGVEQPVVNVRVEEFVSTELRPLLNYIFFEENSSEVPARYTRLSPGETATFRTNALKDVETLGTYYHVLNIVGERMREKPSAQLTIVGTNADAGAERGNTALSGARAQSAKSYLTDVWGIAPARLTVRERALPEKASNSSDPDGIAENRRVEFIASDPAILAPVLISDTLREVNPSTLRFKTQVTSGAGIVEWNLDARQREGVSKSASGSADVPSIVDWPLDAEKSMIPRNENPITYGLHVRDAANQEASSPVHAIPVEQKTVLKKRSSEVVEDKEIDRYNLILFDFGSTALSPQNKDIVTFIRQRISPEATVRITGFTDRIGEAEFNRKLSEARAKSVASELGVVNAIVSGHGETTRYTNDLPEGRFYCRTVSVVVETPVRK